MKSIFVKTIELNFYFFFTAPEITCAAQKVLSEDSLRTEVCEIEKEFSDTDFTEKCNRGTLPSKQFILLIQSQAFWILNLFNSFVRKNLPIIYLFYVGPDIQAKNKRKKLKRQTKKREQYLKNAEKNTRGQDKIFRTQVNKRKRVLENIEETGRGKRKKIKKKNIEFCVHLDYKRFF